MASDLLRPSYSKSCQRVYEDLARYVFVDQEQPSIHLLALAGIGRSKPRRRLPSWVPDLEQEYINDPYTTMHGDVFQASSKFSPITAVELHSKTLSLSGVLCEKIFAISSGGFLEFAKAPDEIIDQLFTAQCKYRFIKAVLELISTHSDLYHKGPEAMLERLWNVLVTNRSNHRQRRARHEYKSNFKHWLRSKELGSYVETFQDLVQLAELGSFDEHIPYIDAIKDYDNDMTLACLGRCFAISEQGRLCLVPPLTQEGDTIFIPYGAQTPYLIRQCKFEGPVAAHELIGEAYVDGMMEGEIMESHFKETTVHLR